MTQRHQAALLALDLLLALVLVRLAFDRDWATLGTAAALVAVRTLSRSPRAGSAARRRRAVRGP